jgi:hypothetical protein
MVSMQKILGTYFKWFIFFFVLDAGFTLALGSYIQYHVVSNDFWTILYYGRHMTLAEPESLYNGFFPFGYAFVIGQLPFTYVLPLSYILNALLAGLFAASVSTLVAATRSVPATVIAFFASIVTPYIFKNANTLSPDIGSVAFTAFAIFLLWRDRFGEKLETLSDLRAVLAGFSLGMAFLWRNHAIVSSVAILFGYFLFAGIRPFRSLVLIVGAFFCILSIQVGVNLVSGHGALETAQAFNIYKFFYGINDTYQPTPEEIKNFSLIDTVMSDPQWALAAYFVPFGYLVSFGWPAAVCFLLSPKGRISRYSLFLLLFVLVYAIPVSVGGSPRAPVMLMGAYVPSLALLVVVLAELVERMFTPNKWVTGLVGIFFIAASAQLFYGSILYDAEFIRANRAERKALAVIEQTLLSSGMESPTEVFADRYDFYTPHKMPYRSREIGNGAQDWIWGFSDEFSPLPNDSWNSFAVACKEQGIRFLVLSPNSFYRGDIFPPIYYEEVNIESLGLQFIAQRGNIRIYKFQ